MSKPSGDATSTEAALQAFLEATGSRLVSEDENCFAVTFDVRGATVHYKDGMLRVTLPKKPTAGCDSD